MTDFEMKAVHALVSEPPVLNDLTTPSAHALDRIMPGFSTERSLAVIEDFMARKLIKPACRAVDKESAGSPWWWEVGPQAIRDIEQEAHVIIEGIVKTYAPPRTPSRWYGYDDGEQVLSLSLPSGRKSIHVTAHEVFMIVVGDQSIRDELANRIRVLVCEEPKPEAP